jgi:ankyrin repeat protein
MQLTIFATKTLIISIILATSMHLRAMNINDKLVLAAESGNIAQVRVLLAQGANVNAHAGDFNNTALHLAVYENHPEIVKILISAKANVNSKNFNKGNNSSNTPLHLAAHKGYISTAKLLIDAGGDTNSTNYFLFTPLHHAIRCESLKMVRVLLNTGLTNVQAKNKLNKSPLDEAQAKNLVEISNLLISYSTLIKEISISPSNSTLTEAITSNFIYIVKMLLRLGIDPSKNDIALADKLDLKEIWQLLMTYNGLTTECSRITKTGLSRVNIRGSYLPVEICKHIATFMQ